MEQIGNLTSFILSLRTKVSLVDYVEDSWELVCEVCIAAVVGYRKSGLPFRTAQVVRCIAQKDIILRANGVSDTPTTCLLRDTGMRII